MPLDQWLDQRVPIRSGRHGLAVETVRRNQRGRLLEAAARVSAERGFNDMTAARLTNRAGVSRVTLYELFGSKDACFLTAAGEAHEYLAARVAEATAAQRPPRERLDEGIAAFMAFCARHPNSAQLVLLGVAGAGSEGSTSRSEWLEGMTEALRAPLEQSYPAAPALTAEILVGGLWHVAGNRLRSGREQELPLIGRVLSSYMLRGLAPSDAG